MYQASSSTRAGPGGVRRGSCSGRGPLRDAGRGYINLHHMRLVGVIPPSHEAGWVMHPSHGAGKGYTPLFTNATFS